MNNQLEILGEHIISESGCYRFVRRWVRGWHPELGELTWGLAGKETIIETSVIRPMVAYEVKNTGDAGVFPDLMAA